MNKKEQNNKGFSLVELIIVIAIMAILVGVLAPQFLKYVERSRISKDMQNVQLAKTAIETAVAGEEGITPTNCSITITGGDADTRNIAVACDGKVLEGVSASIPLSSKNWGSQTYTMTANYTWNDDDCTNSTDTTKYNMANIFK